jgi:nucleolar complex protein 2
VLFTPVLCCVRVLQATLTLVQGISEPSLLAFILKQLKHYTPLMGPFPKVTKSYLRQFLTVWGESTAVDSDARSCQVAAFFRVRQMAVAMPFPCVEECLKGLYLTYARNARFMNEQVRGWFTVFQAVSPAQFFNP